MKSPQQILRDARDCNKHEDDMVVRCYGCLMEALSAAHSVVAAQPKPRHAIQIALEQSVAVLSTLPHAERRRVLATLGTYFKDAGT